jgi:hypothetical protein
MDATYLLLFVGALIGAGAVALSRPSNAAPIKILAGAVVGGLALVGALTVWAFVR